MERLARIQKRLEMLRKFDYKRSVFGASTHKYISQPPLSEELADHFEELYKTSIPVNYRSFLTKLSSGGAGPAYGFWGLTPLEREELPQINTIIQDYDGNELSRSGTGPREVPQVCSTIERPFLLSKPWSPSEGALPIPPGTSPYDGCLHLAEIGSGLFYFLVVRGPAKGQIWIDETAEGGYGESADGAGGAETNCKGTGGESIEV